MNVTDAITFNREFQENAVKNKTKEFNPIKEIIGHKYKAIEFTQKIFELYPELFDGKGSTLYYILNAGQSKKVSALYSIFEVFCTNSQQSVFASILNGIEPIGKDVDPIFSWARYLRKTKKCYIYEPVLSYNNKALQEFLNNNRMTRYQDKVFSLNELRPLCYINTGENICDLLPYIAYLYNFFINCNNYTFSEILAGSTHNAFMEAIEANFNNYYQKLLSSVTGMTLAKLFSKPDNFINHFAPDVIKSMYSEMLNPENMIEIRNRVIISDATNELSKAVSSQTEITPETVHAGFAKVMGDLIDIVIKKNPITKFYKKLPQFSANNVNQFELSQWTSYAISGGNHPFIINSDLTTVAVGDNNVNHNSCPMIPPQILNSEIKPISLIPKQPFTNSSIALNLITAYVKMKFIDFQNDILNDYPITIDESFISTERFGTDRMENIIAGLFVNGIYGKEYEKIKQIFTILQNNKMFTQSIENILKIPYLLEILFDNKFGAKIMSAYILSFIPKFLTDFLASNGQELGLKIPSTQSINLNRFCPMGFFCQKLPFDPMRIEKLLSLETAIMFLHNKSYTNFVNDKVNEMITILTTNCYIQQPFVKGTSDPIDVYAIGGRDCVAKAALSNPLLRAYWFIYYTQGTCENMEIFYEWIKYLDNNYAFDLLTQAIHEKNFPTIRTVLTNKYNEMITSNNVPVILNNYEIESNGNWYVKSTPYFIDLLLPDGMSIVEFLANFTYAEVNAKHIADKQLILKPIVYSNGTFIAKESGYNKAIFGNNSVSAVLSEFGVKYKIPYYDYSIILEDFGVDILAPTSYNLLYLTTDSGDQINNDVYFIYTALQNMRFDGKKFGDSFDNIIEPNNDKKTEGYYTKDGIPMYKNNNIDPRKKSAKPNDKFNRMMILGLDKQPIPNVNQN